MESDVEFVGNAGILAALPNELLMHVLAPMSTLDLLPLAAVCQRFHNLVVRIITYRVADAATLNGNTLLLECYAPSQRLTEPHLSCSHIETQGLDEALEDQDAAASHPPGYILKQLRNSYSVFQLHRKARKRLTYKHPAGDIPGSRTYTSRTSDADASTDNTNNAATQEPEDEPPMPNPERRQFGSVYEAAQTQAARPPKYYSSSSTSSNTEPTELVYEPVIQHAHLEAGCLFTQLCAESSIALIAPFSDTFVGFEDLNKGVLRVWRHWLADRAAEEAPSTAPDDEPVTAMQASGAETTAEPQEASREPSQTKGKQPQVKPAYNVKADSGVLWVGHGDTIGIRFRVRELKWRRRAQPVLMHVDEDPPVSYELRYDQLLVRTSDLLLASERADARQRSDTGKAVLFGRLYTAEVNEHGGASRGVPGTG